MATQDNSSATGVSPVTTSGPNTGGNLEDSGFKSGSETPKAPETSPQPDRQSSLESDPDNLNSSENDCESRAPLGGFERESPVTYLHSNGEAAEESGSADETFPSRGSELPEGVEFGHGSIKPDQEAEDSSSEDGNLADLGFRKKMAPRRLRQYKQYIELMEDRMAALEDQVAQLTALQRHPSPPASNQGVSPLQSRVPSQAADMPKTGPMFRSVASGAKPLTAENPEKLIIPKFKVMGWQQFHDGRGRSYLNLPENTCAIDILLGSPMFDYTPGFQPSGPQSISGNASWPESITERYLGPLPERIRINSPALIGLLENLADVPPGLSDNTALIFRPFRRLVYSHETIKRWLKRFERRWRQYPVAGDVPSSVLDSKPSSDEQKPKNEGDQIELSEAGDDADMISTNEKIEPIKDITEMPRYCGGIQALHDTRLLVDFIETTLKPHVAKIESGQLRRFEFYDLWYLYKPGDIIVTSRRDQAYRIESTTGMSHKDAWHANQGVNMLPGTLTVNCVSMATNGDVFGPVDASYEIAKYSGEEDITSLSIYPLRFDKDPEGLQQVLIERGRKVVDTSMGKHAYCKGMSIIPQEQVDSQVVIDVKQAIVYNQRWAPGIRSGENDSPKDKESKPTSEHCQQYQCCWQHTVLAENWIDKLLAKDYIQKHSGETTWLSSRPYTEKSVFTDNELMLVDKTVLGFVLRTRKWAQLDVKDIHEVVRVPEEDGFDQLVIPSSHKKMLRSVVGHHFRKRRSENDDEDQVDLIRGKGTGLIILLHGVPGVGKTSTAECIADSFEKPLFPVTCGDLGITPADVERNLEFNFTLAQKWDCILLLDEADVFLSERTKEDFTRNSLVSVFLRVLEYYSGILFLTTNRVGAFDEAFRSRIHLELYYPPLDFKSTLKVWKVGLAQTKKWRQKREEERVGSGGSIRIKRDDILEFAAQHFHSNPDARWNGRQIRNAFQIAIALAEYDAKKGEDRIEKKRKKQRKSKRSDEDEDEDGKGEKVADKASVTAKSVTLRRKHFEQVAQASLDFDEYLKDLYGMSMPRRAHLGNLRYDHHSSADDDRLFANPNANPPVRRSGFASSQPIATQAVAEPATHGKAGKGSKSSGKSKKGAKSSKGKKSKKEEDSSSSSSDDKDESSQLESGSDSESNSESDSE